MWTRLALSRLVLTQTCRVTVSRSFVRKTTTKEKTRQELAPVSKLEILFKLVKGAVVASVLGNAVVYAFNPEFRRYFGDKHYALSQWFNSLFGANSDDEANKKQIVSSDKVNELLKSTKTTSAAA